MNAPGSSTPPDRCARPLPHFDVAFRQYNGVGSCNHVISGLNHTARSLAVYASQGELSRRQARLASGWLANPVRAGVGYPLGPNERFQVIQSPFPRLRLAHCIFYINLPSTLKFEPMAP
jgi:hypothetical protein